VSVDRPFRYAQELQNALRFAEQKYRGFRQSYVRQSAVIPYRKLNNKMQILLVTSADTQQWLFPKGNLDQDESYKDAAQREAYEEAGVKGELSDEAIGVYDHEKLGKLYCVEAFAMEVTSELTEWPEDKIRRRKWLERDSAANLVQEEYVRQMIADFYAALE
jgi:8-oxo-dGTP pyrophosphatase MutT (NUDIX family)